MTNKPQNSGSGWTQQQRTGQDNLNSALSEARRAPVEGNDVPAEARRAGSMDS